MIIAITGLSGSGKTTLGALIAKKLGYTLVAPSFKDLAKKEGISLMEFQARAAKDQEIDRKFDEILKEMAVGNCVVTSWLGPWVLNADLRIKLFAPLSVRAMRISGRDTMSKEEAMAHVSVRDNQNRKRFMDVYGIDIDEVESFDACLNSAKYTPERLLKIIEQIIKTKGKNKSRYA